MCYLEPLFLYLIERGRNIPSLTYDEISNIVGRSLCESAKQYKLYWYSKRILFLQKMFKIRISLVSPVTRSVYFEYYD